MNPLTPDEIVARGELAARILADESVISFFDELKRDIKDATFNTLPEDAEGRERLYWQMRGVEDVLSVMLTYQQTAEKIENTPIDDWED